MLEMQLTKLLRSISVPISHLCVRGVSRRAYHALKNHESFNLNLSFARPICSCSRSRHDICGSELISIRRLDYHQVCGYNNEVQGIGSFIYFPIVCNVRYRSKTIKPSKRRSTSESPTEDSGTDSDNDFEDVVSDVEVDPDAPSVYKDRKAHSLRADNLVGKGLGLSNSETEQYFYQSRFIYNGKTLLKKARKLEVGEHIDVIVERNDEQSKVKVKRVQVIAVDKNTTKTGKPMVTIRTWRKAFEIDTPVDLQKS